MGSYDRVQDGVETFAGLFANEGANVLETTTRVSKGIPGLGQIISGAQGAYHAGSAIYDGLTGDRDGAVAHGAQSIMGFAGAIPGVSQALSSVDTAMGIVGGTARLGQGLAGKPGEGIEPGDIPASITDVVSSAAVGATNSIFGADDSNWFAEGNTPQGTRAGEINAGLQMLGGPAGMLIDHFTGAGEKGVAQLLGSDDKKGTTSGAKPGMAAQMGQDIHGVLGPTAGGAIGGAILGGLAMGPMGIIPGIFGGMAAADVDQQLEAMEQNGGTPMPSLPTPTPSNPTPGVPSTSGGGGTGNGQTMSGPGPQSDGSPYGGGYGGADTKAGKSESWSRSPGPGGFGSPGIQPGPADGTVTPGIDHQLIGPGGLLTPPPAAPAGPMPYGVTPKGNGAPMSGPAPKMPWFFENAGPSTW